MRRYSANGISGRSSLDREGLKDGRSALARSKVLDRCFGVTNEWLNSSITFDERNLFRLRPQRTLPYPNA
jgi:hypothetical protein